MTVRTTKGEEAESMMYKCRGKYCQEMVKGEDRLRHIQQAHPRFYGLLLETRKESKMPMDERVANLFSVRKEKRMRA